MDLSCRERLGYNLGLFSLACRKLRSDRSEWYKITRSRDKVNIHSPLLKIENSKISGHGLEVRREIFRMDLRGIIFIQ